ncbi:hypothetical protein ACROYT_G033425 [Oculina patagonica]
MATKPPSPLASSVEKTNGNKLSRLLIDGGTTVLRNVFHGFHPPSSLTAVLTAHMYIMQTLRKKGVLHRPQWEQLFPPGGTAPDSNTFDITLLFLLLTNICGLCAPPSGWHKPPPASDTSLEANLCRIKLFRNEIYGHVTTTGMQTPMFDIKWQEVSVVLVALGLNKAEIDRLKSAPCGEDYVNAITEWAKSDEEIKSQLKEVHESLKKGQQAIQDLVKTQKKNNETLQEIKKSIERKEHDILKRLAEVNTQSVIEYYAERYQQGTRLSILDKVERWLDDRHSQNRVMVISGHAGMGKSVMSAVLCKRMQEAGRLFGCHFCQYDKACHRNPKVMLQSLAFQLSWCLTEYREALVEKLSRNLGLELNEMEVNDLFEKLFEESLCSVTDPGKNILIVLDGLDESEYQERNALIDVIANHFYKFPSWIRFLITTRPEINIADRLKKHYQPLQMDPSDEENVSDIRLCFKEKLSDLMQIEYEVDVLEKLVQKTQGVILFSHFLIDFIKKRNVSILSPRLLDSTLPLDISSVYRSYFKRLENELCKELEITEDRFFNCLSAIVVAREPLPLGFVSQLLLSTARSLDGPRKHGVQHILELEDARAYDPAEIVKKYVVDLELVYAKLCVSNTAASEDIICIEKKQGLKSPSTQNTLLFLLRKYNGTLRECPHSLFQIVLNEGTPKLSSEARSLLESKYSEVPYMECLHKEDVEESLQARFLCSTEVVCFDVSSHAGQLELMVCECRDETIQLWSLYTGKLVWVRPVMLIKSFSHPFEAYRRPPSTPVRSFYRSVVFHPNEEVVLPGILSHAYTLDGDFKPLYPKSSCRFTICSVSGARSTMLTDCPDDARCIVIFSLEDGSEIARITRNDDVLSFAWCQDGSLIAISHCTGSVCLVDGTNDFRTLSQITTPEICGMLKFSPDRSFVLGLHVSLRGQDECLYHLDINKDDRGTISLKLSSVQVSYQSCDFEASGEAGFLFGDPVYCLFERLPNGSFLAKKWGLEIVLSEQAVLRGSPNDVFIDMLNISKLTKYKDTSSGNHAKKLAFSLNGDTIYVVCDAAETTIMALDGGALELWDFGLSKCVRRWTTLGPKITQVIPITEERVACVEREVEVNVLDTTSGDIVSTIPIKHKEFVACNSQCQLITIDYRSKTSIQLWDGESVLWEKDWSYFRLFQGSLRGMFSPTEQFVVISTMTTKGVQGACVLDAVKGDILRCLYGGHDVSDLKFVGDEECVIFSCEIPGNVCLRLFNVRTGDLLSVMDVENSANFSAACPRKRLIAIGLRESDSKPKMKLII